MNFHDMIESVKEAVKALAGAATTLENKNLSDILNASAAKLTQAQDHPDVHQVAPEAVRGRVLGEDASRFGGEAAQSNDPKLPFGDDKRHGSNAHGLGPDTGHSGAPQFDDPSKQGSG